MQRIKGMKAQYFQFPGACFLCGFDQHGMSNRSCQQTDTLPPLRVGRSLDFIIERLAPNPLTATALHMD